MIRRKQLGAASGAILFVLTGTAGCGGDGTWQGISPADDAADAADDRDRGADGGATDEGEADSTSLDAGRDSGDGGGDVGDVTGTPDRADGPEPSDGDAPDDASPDAEDAVVVDAALDTKTEAGADASPDVTVDAMTDSTTDARDGGADRSIDAKADGPTDASIDTPSDRPSDAPSEAGCTLLVRGNDSHPTSACPLERTFAPLAARSDWRVQDYPENLGVVAVEDRRATGIPGLVLSVRLGDDSVPPESRQRKGEILLDLRYVPGMDGQTPIDLTGRSLRANVQVPSALADGRNGVQLFVKDSAYRSQYGTWHNLAQCGPLDVMLSPGPHSSERHAYTEPGFEPKSIRIIGFKVGLGDASSTSYAGPVQLVDFTIDAPIPLLEEPSLPSFSLRPSLVGRHIEARDGHVLVDSVPSFIVGGNWRAIDYGQNFGATKWFPLGNGMSKHAGYARCELDRYRRAGVQWLRVGLLDDGRAVFDAESKPLPVLDAFHADVAKFLDLCSEAGIGAEFALADFLVAAPAQQIEGVVVQGRRALIEDAATRDNMIATFLKPFLERYGNHPAFVAFDCLNEPEWLIAKSEGGGWDDVANGPTKASSPVALTAMRSFITACARAVGERQPARLVTLGVSARMAALQEKLTIGYSAIHHYPWMGPLANLLSGFRPDIPWILEEYPSLEGAKHVDESLNAANALGAGGALIWNLTPNLDDQTMTFAQRNEVLSALSSWYPPRDAGVHRVTERKGVLRP